ncbi:MAG TPA: hypothetical protein VGM53_14675 [Streptosporangiaceae bacterium]|jgi:hypothetical protein
MNADLGELLREGIDRATAGERIHPGLAGRARQRHHRRTFTVRAAAVSGTAAVAAAVVFAAAIGAGGSAQPGGRLQAQTTAYVAGHTERALAAAGRGNLIERVTATPPRGIAARAVAVRVPAPGKPHGEPVRHLSPLTITRTTSWSYRGLFRTQGFAPGGQLAIDEGPSAATRPARGQPAPGFIAVDPNAGKWYRPLRLPAAAVHPGPSTCGNQGINWQPGNWKRTAAQWTVVISRALSCHLFRAAGHQRADGVDAIRLAATPRLLRQIPAKAWDITTVTLWVNSKTFLPVRLMLAPGGGSDEFGWLKPTKANLARLRVKIPAGSREVRLPANATSFWEVVPARTR